MAESEDDSSAGLYLTVNGFSLSCSRGGLCSYAGIWC
jgi:hypothetical protein